MKNILTNIKQVFSKIMNMKIMNINMKYIFFITIIVIGSLIYGVYRDKRQSSTEDEHYKVVREYLLNDHPLVNKKKPLLWIHLDYRINSRDWISFNSRNSNNLNQPYLFLTIKSIVDKCGNDFNICIIDDNTLMYVALHEISHICSKSIGHNDEFWSNFKFVIQEAKELGIYNPVNYKKNPARYCGMNITDNPYYDY